ncbi:MAG TPA: serine hydrolase domain-containing protein [Puia sp.]|jgi:CubicO group peptidase (beta-lactamase class C family)|nr:serine hydrolase domain-containing protein [Puia sp.]
MRKIILLSAITCTCTLLIAQTSQTQKIDSVCILVKQYFNEKNPAKIYDLTGESFRNVLSPDAFKTICENNLFVLGEMKKTEFENHAAGVSTYKATIGAVNLSLLLSLDSRGKIEVFLFKPYVDETRKKNYAVPSSNPLTTTLDKQVDSAVRSYISLEATVGLSIGIIKQGSVYYYGYGETARGNKKIPDEHTLFEIGSLSKTFTSILLADAVNSGAVKLDDPMNKYLPDSIPKLEYGGVPITLKTLANHSSGLPRMPSNFYSPDDSNPYKDYDQKDLFSFYRNFKPIRKPGEKYEYSNLAAGTLGVILERVNHASYETLFLGTICRPLHMNETREFLLSGDSARFAKGYDEQGAPSSQWDFMALGAAGAIRSTNADLLKYALANLGDAPPKLLKAIKLTHVITFSEGQTKVGLAWHYIKPGKDELIFHNGQTGGYHSYLAFNEEKKFAVIILSNCAKGTEDIGGAVVRWLETNQ